jgi:hypothetical protein
MSEEDDCDDIEESDISTKYFAIKKIGTPCEIKEARSWYKNVMLKYQGDVKTALTYAVINFGQNIPITKIKKGELENILDDCDYLSSLMSGFQLMLTNVYEMYHNPAEWNAWKGSIDGEVAYFVEKKTAKNPELDNGMFV